MPSRRARITALWIASLGLALSVGWAGPAAAAEPDEPPRWAYQMPHSLMSPFCPGRTLAECSSPQADQLRLWILVQASAGAPQEEIEATLLERFGDKILSAPRAEGWGITAYALPIGGFLLGGVAVAMVLRRMARPESEAARSVVVSGRVAPAMGMGTESDAELERCIDEDLRA